MSEQARPEGELLLTHNVEADLGRQALDGAALLDSQRSAVANLAGFTITGEGGEERHYLTMPGPVAVVDASSLRKT